MSNLHSPIKKKLNQFTSAGITMRLRLFFFLFLLVITMAAGIIIILLITGTFSAGLKESRALIQNELIHSADDVSTQCGQISVQTVEFSIELSKKIEDTLNKQNITFQELSNHPDQLEELLMNLFEKTYDSLEQSNSTGAFFILDTTINPALSRSAYSKAGLYIKNMEPNVISSSSPTFTLLRGFSDIGRSNSMNLHTQWSMEFDVSDADYYSVPIEAFYNDKELPLSKLYYWSSPTIIPGTSEEVLLCSAPLVDSENNCYGVCGFDISAMLFKLTNMPTDSTYPRMFCMFSPLKENIIEISRSFIAGGYSVKDISKENTSLTIKENRNLFTTYTSDQNTEFLGQYQKVQLYPNDSPFISETWIDSILVPKEDIVDSIVRLNIIIVSLLSLLLITGIVISIIFSNKYLEPISQGIKIIKSVEEGDAPKTKVQEIDDLINYLSNYKKELSEKMKQEKHQIALLEDFVEKTKLLSPAEQSVFNLYMKGLSSKEIADELFLSINTIKTHSKRIFLKLGVTSREELLLYINMLKEIGLEIK